MDVAAEDNKVIADGSDFSEKNWRTEVGSDFSKKNWRTVDGSDFLKENWRTQMQHGHVSGRGSRR